MNPKLIFTTIFSLLLLISCKKRETGVMGRMGLPGTNATEVSDPDKAPKVSVDRFSAAAGHLMIRTSMNGLPAKNAPINF